MSRLCSLRCPQSDGINASDHFHPEFRLLDWRRSELSFFKPSDTENLLERVPYLPPAGGSADSTYFLVSGIVDTASVADIVSAILSYSQFVQHTNLDLEGDLALRVACAQGDITENCPPGDPLWTYTLKFTEIQSVVPHLKFDIVSLAESQFFPDATGVYSPSVSPFFLSPYLSTITPEDITQFTDLERYGVKVEIELIGVSRSHTFYRTIPLLDLTVGTRTWSIL